MLDKAVAEIIRAAYALSTWSNFRTHTSSYIRFARRFGLVAFPLSESALTRYAAFLSFTVNAPKTVLNYINGLKSVQKLLNLPPFIESPRLQLVLRGLKRTMRHCIRQAAPITPAMLLRMSKFVRSTTDVVCFTALLVGFNLFLRKSNLVPDSCSSFDPLKQLTRQDLRCSKSVFLVSISWTKTIQFQERTLLLPLLRHSKKELCTHSWLRRMLSKIPATPADSLRSLLLTWKKTIPLSRRTLLMKLRLWIRKLHMQPGSYSLHSLRRGGATFAFRRRVPLNVIRLMGDWISDCFLRYIDIAMDTRLHAVARLSR